MKKKWFFGIIMLVLCISALAVGVFSAQKASLSVGTTLGFSASNCNTNVKCQINNFANENGQKTSKTLEQNILASKSTASGSMDLGEINFYRSGSGVDGIDPIEVVITITNLSDDPSECTITVTNPDTTNILMTCGIYDNFLPYTFQLISGESLSFTITYKLKTQTTLSATNLGISLSLTDYTVKTQSEWEAEGYSILDDEMPVLLGVPDWTTGKSTTLYLPKLYKDSNGTIKEFYCVDGGIFSNFVTGYEHICIPNGVTTIANPSTNYTGTMLKTVCFPDTVTTMNSFFENYSGSTVTANVPQNIQTLSYGAFSYTRIYNLGYTLYGKYVEKYPSLAGLKNLESLETCVFDSCTGLTYVDLSASTKLTSVTGLSYTDVQSIILPEGLKEIGYEAFDYCQKLKYIEIPSSVTTIATDAFYNCTSLTSITLPNSITSIGDAAFSYCTALTSINIPASCTLIDNCAFYGCAVLTSVTLPEGLKTIGSSAFKGCTALTSLTIPDNCTSIGDGILEGCKNVTMLSTPYVEHLHNFFNSNGNGTISTSYSGMTLCEAETYYKCYAPSGLTTVYVTNSEYIGDRAFQGFTQIVNVFLSDKVQVIANLSFHGCSSLKYITLDRGIKFIGIASFQNCSSLCTLWLNGNIVSIDHSAFAYSGSTKLNLVYLRSDYGTLSSSTIPDFYQGSGDEALNFVKGYIFFYSEFNPGTGHSYWHWTLGDGCTTENVVLFLSTGKLGMYALPWVFGKSQN